MINPHNLLCFYIPFFIADFHHTTKSKSKSKFKFKPINPPPTLIQTYTFCPYASVLCSSTRLPAASFLVIPFGTYTFCSYSVHLHPDSHDIDSSPLPSLHRSSILHRCRFFSPNHRSTSTSSSLPSHFIPLTPTLFYFFRLSPSNSSSQCAHSLHILFLERFFFLLLFFC